MATVTVRDLASFDANTPPPTSIWLSSQPPKMSPLALVSAGIASVRMQRSPRGSVSDFSVMSVSPKIVPARIGRKAPAESLGQRAQGGYDIFHAARARVVQRTAAERCISGAEDHGAVDRIGIVDDTFAECRDADIGHRQHQAVDHLVGDARAGLGQRRLLGFAVAPDVKALAGLAAEFALGDFLAQPGRRRRQQIAELAT